MPAHDKLACTAFDHQHLIASGDLRDVARAAKLSLDAGSAGPLLIFDDRTGHQVEIDFRGTLDAVLARLSTDTRAPIPPKRGPGRPKLGVVPREVTLMPRHWDWLARQPAGASATLRRLVEQALRSDGAPERARQAFESVDHFMRVMAGDLPGYEEASRAFYRGARERLGSVMAKWPADIRTHVQHLAAIAWDEQADVR